jgi:hypothetical protein
MVATPRDLRQILTFGNCNACKTSFTRCTRVRELHMVFKVPHIYDYITKLYRGHTKS